MLQKVLNGFGHCSESTSFRRGVLVIALLIALHIGDVEYTVMKN